MRLASLIVGVKLSLVVLTLALAAVPVTAQLWTTQLRPVYSTQTLQEAINSAQDGDVLYADFYRPQFKGYISVGSSITLVGGQYYGIQFSGPGHGYARLEDAQVLADPSATNGSVGISVAGFDLVGVIRSSVEASGYATYANPVGASALLVRDSTALLLIGSTFRATIGGTVPEYTCEAPFSGWAAVHSPGTVYAANSLFLGGGDIHNFWDYDICPSGPYNTASGAPGLKADTLFHSGCTFVGGLGASWWNHPDVGASGPAWEARVVYSWPRGKYVVR